MAREWKRQEELRKILADKWNEAAKHRTNPGDKVGRGPPVAAAASAFVATAPDVRVERQAEQAKRYMQREVDGDLDEVESSVAPLGFDLDGLDSTDRMVGLNGAQRDDPTGTEALSVDSM